MARTFGDVMRDIGRALGMDSSSARGAGGTTRSIGGDIRQSMMSPGERQLAAMQERRSNRDDRQAAAAAPAAPPAAVAQPVQPGAAAPGTLTPPGAPAPVNPSDMASTGAAEDAALASAQQGRASTIATGAQGLLAEEEPMGLLRRRRSLVGGGLIA